LKPEAAAVLAASYFVSVVARNRFDRRLDSHMQNGRGSVGVVDWSDSDRPDSDGPSTV